MTKADKENRKQLEKVVLDFLENVALSYGKIDEDRYEYFLNHNICQKQQGAKRGIHLSEDGSHYLMYTCLGPYDLGEEADIFFREMSSRINIVNSIWSGTSFYIGQTGTKITINAEREYDTFDGMPTVHGLIERQLDLIEAFGDAAPLLEKAMEYVKEEYGLCHVDEDTDDGDIEIFFHLN